MKKFSSLLFFFIISAQAYAKNPPPFRNVDGTTKWQHVANFSASVLIITLLIAAVFLFIINRRAARVNRELIEIKATLEDRVARRTASLQETTANLQGREAYIASIVDSMPLMLIGLNQNMEVIQWNHVAETVTGRPIATVLGKKLWEAYPSITLTPQQVASVLTSKETITINHSQRDQYYFDFTLYALTDYPLTEKGETGLVILVDDITKQVKAENKLAERDKMSAMGELASAMAYDINLPLQTILSTLDAAKNQLSTAESFDSTELVTIKASLLGAIATAQRSGQQATAIIQNLLALANSHRDQKQLTDVSQIMDESIKLASNLFADASGLSFKNITIERNYAPSLPKVPCFSSELQQVFVGVLRHAFHSLNSSNANPPFIDVEVGEFYDTVWIKIQHNGKVLTAEEQQDIFQPFFSNVVDSPACPVEQRLSYSYYMINDHHHGQMAVTSNETQGTTFHIQLPLV